jgi:hypothetical protein
MMQVNLRRGAIILGAIVIVLILLVVYLQLMGISDPPTNFALTATSVSEHNATVEVFIRQTQAAMPQTPQP